VLSLTIKEARDLPKMDVLHGIDSYCVVGIDNLQVAQIARLAGAPKVKGAGVDMMCRLGETVHCEEPR
jgi:thymidine phosphorylase